jgi:hypothetical protein
MTYPVKSSEPKRPYISTMEKIRLEQQKLSWIDSEPEKDPYSEIKKGIKWIESPEGQRFIHLFGYQISPEFKWALEQEDVSDEVRDIVFKKYPFLRVHFKEDE